MPYGCATCANFTRTMRHVPAGTVWPRFCNAAGSAAVTNYALRWLGAYTDHPPCPGWVAGLPSVKNLLRPAPWPAPVLGRWCDVPKCLDYRAPGSLKIVLLEGEICACGATQGPPFGWDGTLVDLGIGAKREQPLRYELRFVGGGSDKFYRVETVFGDCRTYRLSWGRNGTNGQGMTTDKWDKVDDKLRQKQREGYVHHPTQPAAPAHYAVQQFARATFYPTTRDKLAQMAITHGWQNEPDPPGEVAELFHGSEAVRVYRDTGGDRWAVVRYRDGERTVARLKEGK